MSRLMSVSVQPEFGHLTTLRRHSVWCFLKYKLINVEIRKTMSAIRLNVINFSLCLQHCARICLFVSLFVMYVYFLFQINT